MEGSGIDGLRMKFREGFKPALHANYTFWPLVQLMNFALLPLPYRVPFISFAGIFWNGYLRLGTIIFEVLNADRFFQHASWLNNTNDKKLLTGNGNVDGRGGGKVTSLS